jgi:hypothetical protein
MDEQVVRERAGALCQTLLAGDISEASKLMSPELQRNLGPVVGMLPLPLSAAEVESANMTGTGYRTVLLLTGDAGATRLETRWKERDGQPTMVEASHIAEAQVAEEPAGSADLDGDAVE